CDCVPVFVCDLVPDCPDSLVLEAVPVFEPPLMLFDPVPVLLFDPALLFEPVPVFEPAALLFDPVPFDPACLLADDVPLFAPAFLLCEPVPLLDPPFLLCEPVPLFVFEPVPLRLSEIQSAPNCRCG